MIDSDTGDGPDDRHVDLLRDAFTSFAMMPRDTSSLFEALPGKSGGLENGGGPARMRT